MVLAGVLGPTTSIDALKYWEIIADNLSKAGWSYGYVSALDRKGRTIWIVDAHRDRKRYDAVNAILLNEFLKEHRKVQELEANAVQQQRNFAQQQKQIKALTDGLQKVSAQLELSKSTPRTVLNSQ